MTVRLKIGIAFMVFVMTGVLIGAVWMAISTTNIYWKVFDTIPQTTMGIVVDKYLKYGRYGSSYLEELSVAYFDEQGNEYRGGGSFRIGEYQVGDKILVYYDHDQPKFSSIRDQIDTRNSVVINCFIALFILGTSTLVVLVITKTYLQKRNRNKFPLAQA